MKQHENLTGWPIIWWLFTIFGVPITVPWLLYLFIDLVRYKRRKASLKGKVVLITGASSGLGESLAHKFYSCGCRVILVARRKEELERVKKSLLDTHNTVPTHPPIVLALDISEINSLQAEIDKVLTIHGQIDILVNNAGISFRGDVVDTNVNVDIKVMLVNYFAQIALSKAVLPSMIKRQSGHIVCVCSVQAKIALPCRSAYGASKHALQAWCDSARAELADKKIKVTVVNPGYIKTALSLNALTGDGQNYGVMDKTIEQGYTPEYVADRIVKAVLMEEKETMIAPLTPRGAAFIRYFSPSLYFKIMERRYKSKSE